MHLKLLIISFVLVIVYIAIYCYSNSVFETRAINRLKNVSSETIICSVVCGVERAEEVIVTIKSALIFSTANHRLKFVIVTEKDLFELLEEKLESFQTFFKNFSFELVEIKFPDTETEMWRKLFKPCASQRLFLPSLLPYKSIIYVDSDTLFLSPPHQLFNHFTSFNSSQIAGLTFESENVNTGWYSRNFSRHPYYGRFGVNSGVMLMNLERMRELKWEQQMLPIYQKYNFKLVFGDQDIINIYFAYHPDQLYILPCEFNYRPDLCMYMSFCSAFNGIQLIHGNRGYFHKPEDQPIFSQFYDTFQKVKVNKFLSIYYSLMLI